MKKGQRLVKLTDEIKTDILECYKSGMTVTAIGKRHGVGYERVIKFLQHRRVICRPVGTDTITELLSKWPAPATIEKRLEHLL